MILLLVSLAVFPACLSAQPFPELVPYKGKAGWGYADSLLVLRMPPQLEPSGLF